MLPESPTTFLIYLRKVITHLSSNICLPLQQSIPFSCPERVSEIQCFVCNQRVNVVRNGIIQPIIDCQKLSEAPHIYLIHLGKVVNHFSSNGCLSL